MEAVFKGFGVWGIPQNHLPHIPLVFLAVVTYGHYQGWSSTHAGGSGSPVPILGPARAIAVAVYKCSDGEGATLYARTMRTNRAKSTPEVAGTTPKVAAISSVRAKRCGSDPDGPTPKVAAISSVSPRQRTKASQAQEVAAWLASLSKTERADVAGAARDALRTMTAEEAALAECAEEWREARDGE